MLLSLNVCREEQSAKKICKLIFNNSGDFYDSFVVSLIIQRPMLGLLHHGFIFSI